MKASSRSHLLGITLGIASIAFGCARVSKEPEKASPASPPNAHELRVEEPPPSTVVPAAPAQPDSVTSAEKEESAGELRRKRDAERPSARPSRSAGAASRAERSEGAAAKAAAPPPYAPGGDATPTLAESQELQAAVAEFDASWQQLSASHACDDACRAFESMRRSAQRICDLVVAGDPNQRCRTARGRLDQASRDLAARCSACR